MSLSRHALWALLVVGCSSEPGKSAATAPAAHPTDSDPGVVDFAPFGDGVGELWLVATVRAGNHVEHTVDGPFFADDVSVALEVPDALHAITDRGTVSVRVVARDGDVTLAQWTLPRVVWREIDGHTEFSAAADQEERLITSGEVVYADANL